jgi:hypothetical protein
MQSVAVDQYDNLNAATSLPNGHRFPHFLDIAIAPPGSFADISHCKRHVRFTLESGHVRCN